MTNDLTELRDRLAESYPLGLPDKVLNLSATNHFKAGFDAGASSAIEHTRIDNKFIRDRLAFQDKWLSDGVYFTNEDYKIIVSRREKQKQAAEILLSALIKVSDAIISSYSGDVSPVIIARAALAEYAKVMK